MPRRSRVLVVGRDKHSARRAMARHATTHEFVPLAAVSAEQATETGAALLRDVDAAMHERPFEAVVATSESAMLTAGRLRSRYGLPGPGYDASLAVTNKWCMRRTLSGPGIDTPRAWLSGTFAALDEPPSGDVVVKPLASQAARGVRRMASAAARAWLAGRRELWLVEEAVDTVREYHGDGVLRDGRVEWVELSVYDCPVLLVQGTRFSTVLDPDDPRRAVLDRAVRAVAARIPHPDGVFHMEFLDDGERVWFSELGLRPGGGGITEMLRLATGADLWAAFVAAQLGHDPGGHGPLRPADGVSGLVMARPDSDGRPPMPAAEVARLPGVLGVDEGSLADGVPPQDSCECTYMAYYTGLTHEEADVLRARVRRMTPVSGAYA